MKTFSALLAALLLSACGQVDQPTGNTLPGLDRDHFQGRWVVVNYWAQWCKPCIEEIPELNALDERYDQVAVLGVNFDGASGSELREQVEKLGIAFPILLQDPAAQLGTNTPSVLPTTLILDPDGTLVRTLVGPQNLESLALATGQVAMPEAGPTTGDLVEQ